MAKIYPDLWILRHGETEWNVAHRLQGHLDSALTDTGMAQAHTQGEILRRVLPEQVDVLCSPSGRAWRTGEIALKGIEAGMVAEPDLREIMLGDWQGLTLDALRAAQAAPDMGGDPHLWKFGAPGGETLEVMQARVERVLARLTGPTVLITHGLTSRLMRCLVLGKPARALSSLPGGQGVVHRVRNGQAEVLTR